MKILVINSGSSSIKYRLFEGEAGRVLATGLVERIGESSGRIRHTLTAGAEPRTYTEERSIADHHAGLAAMNELLLDAEWGVLADPAEVRAIGHRVVHGGEAFQEPVRITAEVRETIRELSPLAPLHNPANLAGIEVATQLFPDAIQVGVFDTAFHQSMPPEAYRYAIPNRFYTEHGIRAYGFHGTSHHFVSRQAIAHLGRPAAETNLITAHLGNGASMTAVRAGRSVDTSMGFSPLDGLMMGTRSGDLDPAVFYFLGTELGMSFGEVDRILNKESGLLGIAGSNDLRDIEARAEKGEPGAMLALGMYVYRIRKYIGAYSAVLGRVDALVFTAGVGENSPLVRARVCEGLGNLGILLDPEKNRAGIVPPVTEIQSTDSRVRILVIPTNEEWEIARQTLAVLEPGCP